MVGWHLDVHMQEELVVEASKKGLQNRTVQKGLIVHLDRGGQYAGRHFRKLLDKASVWQSMSRIGNVYDNIFMEALFSRFKADAQTEIFEYIVADR
jgi:putative transposase